MDGTNPGRQYLRVSTAGISDGWRLCLLRYDAQGASEVVVRLQLAAL